MTSSEQLEQQAEATRANIDQTLAELRARISPAHIVNQAADYANDKMNGDVIGTLGRQIADNPIPFMLMGAGLAWLLVAPRRRRAPAVEQQPLVQPDPFGTSQSTRGETVGQADELRKTVAPPVAPSAVQEFEAEEVALRRERLTTP